MSDYRLLLCGQPVKHSLSPMIHQSFAQEFKLKLTYQLCEVSADDFPEVVRNFKNNGGTGMNITLPHKTLAYQLADYATEAARQAQAANTLIFKDNEIIADNTDGIGLIRDLASWPIALEHKQILLLGAGGAARGILPLLLAQGAQIHLANRTLAHAEILERDFAITISTLNKIPDQSFDIIINATSCSLAGTLPDIESSLFHPRQYCYDLAYQQQPTRFLAAAQAMGVTRIKDGKGMLLQQAAQSFYLWTGYLPTTENWRWIRESPSAVALTINEQLTTLI